MFKLSFATLCCMSHIHTYIHTHGLAQINIYSMTQILYLLDKRENIYIQFCKLLAKRTRVCMNGNLYIQNSQ